MPWPEHSGGDTGHLEVRQLGVRLGGNDIVSKIDLRARPGEMVGIVGPNGCGKSTLLRAIGRLTTPHTGRVHLDGDDVWQLSAQASARRIGIVLQDHPADVELTAGEVVAMGRLAHRDARGGQDCADAIVTDALESVGAGDLAHRSFPSLSGGERQRVLVARCLAQQAQIMLLDEPTNHLDIGAQLDLLDLVGKLTITKICVLHDLNHAAARCDRIYLMHQGRIVAHGSPRAVLSEQRVQEVFGVRLLEATVSATDQSHLVFEQLDNKRSTHHG